MTFTQKFKEIIRPDEMKMKLAMELGISYSTMIRRLKIHVDDEITKPKYLKVISEVTGLSKDEIFTSND